MNTKIEIHDSRVADIIQMDGTVVVHFKTACLHKSEGRPGFESGTVWAQEAYLIFAEASVSGDFPEWPCDIMEGEIVLDGQVHINLIPLPLEMSTPTELRLNCDSTHFITISGAGVQLELIGKPRYVQEFRP